MDPMRPPLALGTLLALAALRLALHTLTNGQYGFHRDELAFLADARHLDWCFPAYPAFTPLVARLGLVLFGAAPAGVRLFAALAQCGVMLLSGMMARELGGGRRAQVLAAVAVSVSPVALMAGHLFQYVSFDLFWCVLLSWVALRLLLTGDPRWLAAAGVVAGLGLNTRYTMAWMTAGLLAGILASPARRLLWNRWLWAGAAAAIVLITPVLVWQWRHDWLALEFTRAMHARDVRIGRTDGFLWKQLFVPAHLFTAPLWLAGLWFYLRRGEGRAVRSLGWGFLATLALYALSQARDYYTAPLYPMLLAAGAVAAAGWRTCAWRAQWAALAVALITGWAMIVPAAPAGSRWFYKVVSLNGDLAEEVGWPEFVAQVAQVHRALPEAERGRAGLLASNYGEAGALGLYGPALGLPPVMGRTNSFWLRGYDPREPGTVIVTGMSAENAQRYFEACEWKATITNSLGVRNEESSDARYILVCRGPREPWAELWRRLRQWS